MSSNRLITLLKYADQPANCKIEKENDRVLIMSSVYTLYVTAFSEDKVSFFLEDDSYTVQTLLKERILVLNGVSRNGSSNDSELYELWSFLRKVFHTVIIPYSEQLGSSYQSLKNIGFIELLNIIYNDEKCTVMADLETLI